MNTQPVNFESSDILKISNNDKSFGGVVRAIASKSHAHRLLIAGALSKRTVRLMTPDSSQDISATVNTLNGLGASISKSSDFYEISPINLDENSLKYLKYLLSQVQLDKKMLEELNKFKIDIDPESNL